MSRTTTDSYLEKLNILRKEKTIADYIPFSNTVADGIVINRTGDLLMTFKAKGVSFETVDEIDIESYATQLNVLLRAISTSQTALYIHRVRRPVQDRLDGDYGNVFSQGLADKYHQKIGQERLMATELYITLIHRAESSKMSGFLKKASKRSIKDVKQDMVNAIEKIRDLGGVLKTSLSRYALEHLTTYKNEQGTTYSRQLSFYNFLLTGMWQKVRVVQAPLYNVLGNVQMFSGASTLQLDTISGTQYCQSIELKEYNGVTYSGILNALLYPDISGVDAYSFIETQSFSFKSKPDGKAFLIQQKNQLKSADDGALTQRIMMDAALDGLEDGQFAMGEYHYSLLVFGDTPQQAKLHANDSAKKMQDEGFLPFISNLAIEAAYFSQLPGNWEYRPRKAVVTSMNFAGLSPLHNFPDGKRDGNPWGQALALLKTPSEQPYYFNFHTSPLTENSFDKKLLGNTCIIGKSGTGKTVLLNFLLMMAQKYRFADVGFNTILFDKDRGAEIAIRAIGGGYMTVENGVPTGFNPFYALDANEDNVQFLEGFVKLLLNEDGQKITTSDDLSVSHAVRAVMDMPRHLRRLETVRQNMTEGVTREEKENSVVKRLAKWCEGGALAWVFDNDVDVLDFEKYANFGIDGTDLLDNKQVRTPVSAYLLYRMEQIIDGRRFIYSMDEFWKWLGDEAFSEFAYNKQKTIRKQNGLGIFATQSPSDVLTSDIAKAIIEQSATMIYLPNPQADKEDYVGGFKVTETEFEIIKGMAEDSRMFLVKQGHRSTVCRLDLGGGFDDELAILSGSTDNLELLEQARNEAGDDPKDWLPLFHQKRKSRNRAGR